MKQIFNAFLLLCIVPSLVMADTVEVKQGRSARGEITQMTAEAVTIGSAKPIPVDNIKRIVYDGEPRELKSARRYAFEGRNNRIVEELGKLSETSTNPNIRLDVLFYQAFAEAKMAMSGESGTVKTAASSMLKFIRAAGAQNNYHYYEAVEIFGDLAVASEKPKVAITEYTKLTKSKSKSIQLRGLLKVADAKRVTGDFNGAKTAYETAQKVDLTDVDSLRRKLFAGIGAANCSAELGQADQGVKFLNDLIRKEDSSDHELFARAYNALGRCHEKANRKKEAIYAYLYTDVVFFTDPNSHAEALYHLARLWKDQRKNDRAVAARQTLKQRYANTLWAKKKTE